MSCNMRFPTMWYLRPAKTQISLRIRTVWSEPLQESKSLEYFMSIKLLTEHYLEFLSIKWGCKGSYESTFVHIPHCWYHMWRLKYARPLCHCLFQVVKGLAIMMVMQLNLSGKKIMLTKLQGKTQGQSLCCSHTLRSSDIRFPTMWYVWPAKAQISLRISVSSLIRDFASRMNILLLEHNLEFLSLKGGCTSLSESTLVKIPQSIMDGGKGSDHKLNLNLG